MSELTLTWVENGQVRTQVLQDQQPTKNPGTVRLGRDPSKCDILLTDLTVSGLHIEIFFHPQYQSFYLRGLRSSNPPVVDGHSLFQGEVPLRQGSTIYLGQVQLMVTAVMVAIPTIEPTRVVSHPVVAQQPVRPTHPPITPVAPVAVASPPPVPAAAAYSLQCPRCHRSCPATDLNLGCRWCGTSLAAAVSVLAAPHGF